jgi:hypothetical protein
MVARKDVSRLQGNCRPWGKAGAKNMKSSLKAVIAMLGLGLMLSACAKYESFGLVDNNCSHNSGYYDSSYCSSYTSGAMDR